MEGFKWLWTVETVLMGTVLIAFSGDARSWALAAVFFGRWVEASLTFYLAASYAPLLVPIDGSLLEQACMARLRGHMKWPLKSSFCTCLCLALSTVDPAMGSDTRLFLLVLALLGPVAKVVALFICYHVPYFPDFSANQETRHRFLDRSSSTAPATFWTLPGSYSLYLTWRHCRENPDDVTAYGVGEMLNGWKSWQLRKWHKEPELHSIRYEAMRDWVTSPLPVGAVAAASTLSSRRIPDHWGYFCTCIDIARMEASPLSTV